MKEYDFNSEHDLEELEKMLEESEYEEEKKRVEEAPRRSEPYCMSWETWNSRYDGKKCSPMTWQSQDHTVAIEQSQKSELNPLPNHLEYAFLEDNERKWVIITSNLKPKEKKSLVKVFEKMQECHRMEDY